jgi:transaldolase
MTAEGRSINVTLIFSLTHYAEVLEAYLARTIDVNVADAERVMQAIADAGVDMGDVGQTLEDQGVAAFQKSFDHVLGTLAVKHHAMTAN